ncbi:MAG: 16S rRNA (cytidine(1402)-2'-O)-methyltransferase [Vulcanimicrobiota bacterium]
MATPLGNLGDLSERAREVLSRVSFLAGESSQAVLRWIEILRKTAPDGWSPPGVLSYRESSREKDTGIILEKLAQGLAVALISDAGTPGISDPGWFLVRQTRLQGTSIWPVPGPCAAVAALSVCPFPTRRFHFEGFLPHSGKQRKEALSRVRECSDTVVLYESPHRLEKTLEELGALAPSRELFVIREMTKKFEESWWGESREAAGAWADKTVKGEFTLVLAPLARETEEEELSPETIDFLKGLGLPAKTAAGIVRHFHPGLSKKVVYHHFAND